MLPRPKTHAVQAATPSLWPGMADGRSSASSLLRMGLQASPRSAPSTRLFTERPLLLRQRVPSTQLSLFGSGGSR